MKKCSSCGEVRSIKEYYPDKANKDGHKGRCRICIQNSPSGFIAIKRKNDEIIKKYGFAKGSLWRYDLETLIIVYKKYNYRCNDCKSKEKIVIHHIDGNGRNLINIGLKPNNNPSNLMLLCRHCHGSRESIKRWEKERSGS